LSLSKSKGIIAALVLIIIVLAASTVYLATRPAAEVKRVQFGAGGPGGTWFYMVGGAATLLSQEMKGKYVVSVGASAGSVENVRRVATGEYEVALAHGSTCYDAWNGVGTFKDVGKKQDFRMVCAAYLSPHTFVTTKETGIKVMQDLVGKRVNTGPPGSGTEVNSRLILTALGLYDKIKVSNMEFGDAGTALLDGRIDVSCMGGAPAAQIVEVAAQKPIFVIPMTGEEMDKVIAQYPYYAKGVLKANTYQGQPEAVPCITFMVYIIAHKNAPDDFVKEMLRILFDPKNAPFLSKAHEQWKDLSAGLEEMKSLKIPMHRAAVEYWKGQGKSVPAELIPPEMK
jgi:TRAP transporter TAXI family solute receptor